MKIPEAPLLPSNPSSAYDRDLQVALTKLFRSIGLKVNQLGDGVAVGRDNGRTAAPTTGTWQQGDEIFNTTPTELGSAGSKYVIQGWKCVASGTPGTWVQMRFLTGN